MSETTRNVDGGDALFAVAAEITGEASMLRYVTSSVPSGIQERTVAMVDKLSTAIDAGADRRFEENFAAKFEAAFRYWLPIIGGPVTVRADVAPVAREVNAQKGDRFERVDDEGVPRLYTVSDVLFSGVRELTTSTASGFHIYLATLDSLRNPAIFRFVSSEAEREAGLAAISAAGQVAETSAEGQWSDIMAQSAELVGMAVVAPDDDDPPMGPEADVRVGNLRTAAEVIAETDRAVEDLIRVWHAYRYSSESTMSDIQATVEVLAKCAGLPVPWIKAGS